MILKSLIKRKERFALTLIGIILVSSGFSIFVTLTENVFIQTHKSLEESWRYPYDILVRPKNSLTFIEKEHNLVQPNFLSNIYGGITIEQWEKIKDIKEIDVAAPIAIFGYYNVSPELYIDLPENGLYKITMKHITNDGYKEYYYGDWYKHSLDWVYLADTDFLVNLKETPRTFFYICGENPTPKGYIPYSSEYLIHFEHTFIMAGIDPRQEANLSKINEAVYEGTYLDEAKIVNKTYYDIKYKEVSFILNTYPYLDYEIYLKACKKKLGNINILSLTEDEAESLPCELIVERSIDYTEALSILKEDLTQSDLPPERKVDYIYSDYFSRFKPVRYIPQNDHIEAIGLFSDPSGGTVFKEFRGEGISAKNYFFPKVIGFYEIERIPAPFVKGLPAPLYNPPTVILKYDENRNPIEHVQLKPTINIQGYITEPPFMLTTIEGARHIVGDDCISAIRVRVSGIEEINEESFKRIERVAREIVQKTDLHVDIMVGSSPKKVLVHLPDLGYVEELWTQKGVTVEIFRYTKKSNLFIFSISLLVCSLYILNTMLMSTLSRKREIGILKSIGWYNSTIFKMILSESFIIGFIGGIIGMGIAFILSEIFDLILPTSRIFIILPLSVSLSLLGGLYPAYKATRIDPIKAIRFGEIEKGERFGLFMRNILSRKTRSTLVLICIAVSISLFTVLLLTSLNLGNVLEGTLLGEKISFKVEKYHFFSVLICFVISSFAIADIFSRNVYERRKEIGILKSIGWYNKDILKIFFYESLFLGFIGGVLGVFSGILAFLIVSQTSFESLIITFFVGVSLSLLVSILSSLYPIRRINKILPSEAMRYE